MTKKCDRESDDTRTDTHTDRQTQTDFIICPMLYAIAMGQIIKMKSKNEKNMQTLNIEVDDGCLRSMYVFCSTDIITFVRLSHVRYFQLRVETISRSMRSAV